jgi:hypothetical protein
MYAVGVAMSAPWWVLVPFSADQYVSYISARSGKNMEKDVEQYQAWGGGLTLPIWTDVQGWQEGNIVITEVPGIPDPLWFRKILRGKKKLADIDQVPVLGE